MSLCNFTFAIIALKKHLLLMLTTGCSCGLAVSDLASTFGFLLGEGEEVDREETGREETGGEVALPISCVIRSVLFSLQIKKVMLVCGHGGSQLQPSASTTNNHISAFSAFIIITVRDVCPCVV